MCGIAGWVDWGRDLTTQDAVLRAMVDSMAPRGPDAGGVWLSRHAALGHRRLAVIDLEGGAQPMVSPALRRPPVVLTFSGEIYNFRELRADLATLGHRFRTRSDTEVLLHAYLEWGGGCVHRLNGMYAFAVWDGHRQELLLARDRLGIKPLYVAEHGSGVLFGSEPKALLATPLVEAEIDAEGVAELVLGVTCAPGRAVFRGLRELRPGHVMRVSRRGIDETRYWRLTSRPHPDDLPTTVATVRALLGDALDRQTLSDVPLCALLSGGLDSGLLTVLAARSLERRGRGPLDTFAVDVGRGGDGAGRDGPGARALARHLGTVHTAVVLDGADLIAGWERTIRARDLPGAGELDVSLFLLSERVRRRATVALSGEAADEVFGGYSWLHRPSAVASATFPWLSRTGVRLGDLLHPDLRRTLRPRGYVADRYAEALREVPRLEGEEGADRRMRELLHLALTRFLPALLARKDRMSMASGLEIRVPYADHRLVEYVWNVPWAMKTAGGVAKGLLREVASGMLPDETIGRPKSGFPAVSCPTVTATVRARLREVLGDPAAPLRQLIDRVAAGDALERAPDPAAGPLDGWWMSRLLSIDMWLRMYGVRVV
jgi:asparagine synthase (glutamine-hydrolysing)